MRSSWSAFSCSWQQGLFRDVRGGETLSASQEPNMWKWHRWTWTACWDASSVSSAPAGGQTSWCRCRGYILMTTSGPPPGLFNGWRDKWAEEGMKWLRKDDEIKNVFVREVVGLSEANVSSAVVRAASRPVAPVLITLPLSWLCWPLTPVTPYHSNQITDAPLNEVMF